MARWASGHDDAMSLLRARQCVSQGGVKARTRVGCTRSGCDMDHAYQEPKGGGGPCASEKRCEQWQWRGRANAGGGGDK